MTLVSQNNYDWYRIRAVWHGQRSEVLGGEAA
jgi:hypothetical protein